MSRRRTRPDDSRKPSYITADGYRKLEEEAHALWTVERPKLAKAVQIAAAEGDRSENAEYIYGKKKLREIDRRLRFLSKRIDELQIIRPSPAQEGRVFFGAWVTVENEEGEEMRFQIVGPDEYDPKDNRISVDSPMAQALLNKKVGDEAIVKTPAAQFKWRIKKIEYQK